MEPAFTPAARAALESLYPQGSPFDELAATDPEFVERWCNFAFDEVPATGAPADTDPLPQRTRFMANLATLLGCQGTEAFRMLLPAALEAGLEATAVREIVYQAVAYLGFGRVAPFFAVMNEAFAAAGGEVPLPAQARTSTDADERASAGEAKQVAFFGEGMRGFAHAGNPEYPQVNLWLADNCFGDWYTRGGLTGAERELVTFCYLAAQGGCEPQLTSHARANMRIGNTKALLLQVVSTNVPFIGYPRSLNAIRCVEEAAK